MNNPYYDEKLKNLNTMLKKVQDENKDIEQQNQDIKKSLDELEEEIKKNYDEIIKSIAPLKGNK